MLVVLAVALGGALGALGRFGVMTGVGHWLGTGYPYATIVVNVLGSALMGVLLGLTQHAWQDTPATFKMFASAGVLGAFAPFALFTADAVDMAEKNAPFSAISYIVLSVLLSIIALAVSLHLVRNLIA